MFRTRLTTLLLRADVAENSIMQTITIAVSAILIAAGLVTAPGLINNARDNNAREDLSNLAFAQEQRLGNLGAYSARVQTGVARSLADEENIRYSLSASSTKHGALVCDAPSPAYLMKAKSSSGKTFYRSSLSAKTTANISEVSIPSCISYAEVVDFVEPDPFNPVPANPNAGGPIVTPGAGSSITCSVHAPVPLAAYEDGYVAGLGNGSRSTPTAWAGCDLQFQMGFDAAKSGTGYSGAFASSSIPECASFDGYGSGEYPATARAMGESQATADRTTGTDDRAVRYNFGVSFPAACDAEWASGYAEVMGS